MGDAPDMGAYEWGFTARFAVMLEGPYQAGSGTMSTALAAGGSIPLTSPYAADPRTVTAIPSAAVDWVLLQLQTATNGGVITAQSAFLGREGFLLSDDGSTGVVAHARSGSYYLVLRHRNHLSVMSAEPVGFTNDVVEYSFISGAGQFYGGSSGAVEVAGGVWGMAAGDGDGDGEILDADSLVHSSQTNLTDYRRSDFNLDGAVSAEDLTGYWSVRQGMRTMLPDGQVILTPALRVSPGRRTLLAEHGTVFHAMGGTGQVHWALVKNHSGSTTGVEVVTGDDFEYWAGETSGGIDVIEAWDRDNLLSRAYVNIISTNDIAQAGKAIIIAGRKSADDPLWDTTDYLGGVAYGTLRYRGFSTNNICYLSPEPGRDIDDDGVVDIDFESNIDNARYAFTNWAAGPGNLFVYLTDHGSSGSEGGYFRLNPTNKLLASDVASWLDDLQWTYSNDVIVVLDFCQAGSFLEPLAYSGPGRRIVIAACEADEPSYFVAGGLVSFSDAFFSGVLLGLNVSNCYEQARGAIAAYQSAQIYDKDGDADEITIGATFVAGKDIPQIGRVIGNQALMGDTSATLWADDIVSVYPIERVWCSIMQPDHEPNPTNPVMDLVQLELPYNAASARYEATYSGFAKPGVYRLYFYAKDNWGSVSLPRQSYVIQSRFDERVILVAGGPSFAPGWETINWMANLGYHTFRTRLFDNDHIYYMNALTAQNLDDEAGYDVDAIPSLDKLGYAITNWAYVNDTDKLTVYLIGDGTNNTLCVNEGEYLTPAMLAGWLNTFQAANSRQVNVIMDFSGSGAFLPELAGIGPVSDASALSRRVSVASSRANRQSLMARGGQVSFTQYFLSEIFSGESIGDAVTRARKTIRRASGLLHQVAEIDDNGNGIPNEKNTDGVLSRERYIGTAFVTGSDIPSIGSVIPSTSITNTSELLLWVDDVTDVEGISNVWCVITPPDYIGSGELPRLDLPWVGTNDRYEAVYSNFTKNGTYVLTFYAEDCVGDLSESVQSDVFRTEEAVVDTLPDEFEVDNASHQARMFPVGSSQVRTFHSSNDTDWVRFFAVSNHVYDIETVHLGTNVDTVIDMYRQLPDGTLINIDTVDLFGRDEGELAGLDYPTNGLYYVRVSQYVTDGWTAGSYQLIINIPSGGQVSELTVLVLDLTGPPPASLRACLECGGNVEEKEFAYYAQGGFGMATFPSPAAGNYTITVEGIPEGYKHTGDLDPVQFRTVPSQSSLLFPAFMISPYVQVQGCVRDGWTQERLANADIVFTAAGGAIADQDYIDYPNTGAGSGWRTAADGSFPSNVFLPTVDWHLKIAKLGFSSMVSDYVVQSPAGNTISNIGTLYLTPVDSNNNGLPDGWEEDNFGWPTNVDPCADADFDLVCNKDELVCGTDPRNPTSVLCFCECSACSNGFVLRWPVVLWRTYRVRATDDLALPPESWPAMSDCMEATPGKTEMKWTDTSLSGNVNRYYLVEVVTP